jgi:L-ascorbate metabolism protein UlaG (beta-lactamase superfamily)
VTLRPLALPALLLLSGCLSTTRTPPSRIYYHGPVSAHFDGQRFFNPDGESGTGGAKRDGASDYLRIAEGRGHAKRPAWPRSVPVTPAKPPARVPGTAMRVTWVGHATTLVQTQGLNILIDPVWAWRDSPVQLVGPRRVRAPGVRLHDLPPIDLVLISHNHYDHLDMRALGYLARRDHPLIVAGLGNDRLLAEHHIRATAADWGGTVPVKPGITVTLTRAHHWSARWIDDIDRSLWTGFRIALPGGDVYYAGDTGPGDMRWAGEARALSAAPIRLALLPIAPYHVSGRQTGNHIDPAQAVTAFGQLGAGYALGVHWGTFELGSEPIDDAPKRLAIALAAGHIDADRFRTLDAGESWMVPELGASEAR